MTQLPGGDRQDVRAVTWGQPALLAPQHGDKVPRGTGDKGQVYLTGRDGPNEGHQEEMDGVVPGRDDEYDPIWVLADEGRVQLCHL